MPWRSRHAETTGADRAAPWSHKPARSAKLMMTMNSHLQLLGVTFAVMLGAAVTASAQEAATDRSGESGGVGADTATKSEADFNGVDPGSDHGGANRSRAGDAPHIGVSAHDGFEPSRAGAAPTGAPGTMA